MKITFENATIADSVAKAARVAPTRGEAFDKASGILMSLDPEDQTATLRSTNLNIFYLEVVDAVSVEGEGHWRFNSGVFAAVMSKLPIGSGKNVTLEDEGGEVVMRSGKTVARFRVMDHKYYTRWEMFDPELLQTVPDLGARIQQVEWAAYDDPEVVFSGIHLDGEHVIATDRIRMAVTPCEAEPIYRPITIPSGILKPVMSNLRDVAVGIDEGMFLLMPDVSTQIRTRIYEKDYPKVLDSMSRREWSNKVKVRKSAVLEIIDRAVVFAQRDRSPRLKFIIGRDELAVMCSDEDMGLLGDSIELDGQCPHKRMTMIFTPKNLTDALNAAPSEEIELHYEEANPRFPLKIDGGSGYLALVSPRSEKDKDDD